MDIFELLKKRRRFKIAAIGIVIGVLVVFVFMPIITKVFENTVSSDAISQNAIIGPSTSEGGNNYQEIKDDSDAEAYLVEMLTEDELWNTSVAISRKQQIFWYKTLSGYLERTYLQKLESGPRATPNVLGKYATNGYCNRQYISDYSNDECDFNGPVTNFPTLVIQGDAKNETCDGSKLYDVKSVEWKYYKSSDTPKDVGGKIVGLFPDVLTSAALANAYYTLDQNNNEDVPASISGYQKVIERGQTGGMPSSVFQIIKAIVASWYEGQENSAVINRALDDTYAEGSIFSTFDFSMGSECSPVDAFGYSLKYELPCGDEMDLTTGKITTEEYDCILGAQVPNECDRQEICDSYEKDGVKYESCYTDETIIYKNTDGSPNTYYYTFNNNQIGSKAEIPYSFPNGKFTDNAKKVCDYIWEGGEKEKPVMDASGCLRKHNGPFYGIKMYWICSPVKEKVMPVQCKPEPVRDDRNQIIYYHCASIDENKVRTEIVDRVFDSYENHQLPFNDYMTEETVLKYVCPEEMKDNESDECKTARSKVKAGDSNPMDYKIDNATRSVVTKHIVMEILGETEGRTPVICDKDGNFALRSLNRVFNPDQYEDALRNTLFEKDNIYRANNMLNEENHYSEKLFGTFYSEFNEEFDNMTSDEIRITKRLDISRKNSLITEIYSTFEYVTKYITEYGSDNGDRSNGSRGTGLEVADSCNYSIRNGMPYMGSTEFEEYYTIGLYGECAWYATGRAREILASAGKDKNTWTDNTDGGNFCNTADANKFTISSQREYDKPKKGAIISWTGGSSGYGHVAIIEKVEYNEDGSVKGAWISEGGLGIGGTLAGGYTRDDIWSAKDPADIHRQTARKTACQNGSCFRYQFLTVDRLKKYGSSYNFKCYIYLLNDNDEKDENGNCINPNKPIEDDTEDIDEPNPNPTYDDEDNDEESVTASGNGIVKKNCDGKEQNINSSTLTNDQKNIIINGLKDDFGLSDSLVSTYTSSNISNTCKFYNFLTLSEGGDKLNCDDFDSAIKQTAFMTENIDKTLETSNMASVSPGQYLGERGSKLCYQIGNNSYYLSLDVGSSVPKWIIYHEYAEKYKDKKNYATRLTIGKGLTWSVTQLQTLMRISWSTGSTTLQEGFVDAFISNGYKGAWCYVMDILRSGNTIMAQFFNVNEMTFDLFATGTYPQVNPYYSLSTHWKYYSPNLLRKIVESKKADGRSFDNAMYKYIIDHYDTVGATNGYQTCPGYGE